MLYVKKGQFQESFPPSLEISFPSDKLEEVEECYRQYREANPKLGAKKIQCSLVDPNDFDDL